MRWSEHEISFRRYKSNLLLQEIYNGSLVVDCKFCEGCNVLLKNVLLKFIFIRNFLLVPLHHAVAVICVLEGTPDEVSVEVV